VDDALQGRGEEAPPTAPGESVLRAAARAVGLEPGGGWQAPPPCSAAAAARASFPLAFAHAAAYDPAPRLVLVGDAAHVVNPLAGQGLNLGCADAVALARVLRDAVLTGRDCGDAGVLAEYAAEALARNAPMLAALDGVCAFAFLRTLLTPFQGIQRLFASSSPTVALLRSAGLDAVNATPALRGLISRYASG
jgi:ubiquinone biosynthesis monooxygenase Coq6